MRFAAIALALTGFCAQVMAQTPPNTSPSTSNSLSVTYGTTKVTPGIKLSLDAVTNIPTFSQVPNNTNQTYQIVLVDLSISIATVNQSRLVPGVQIPLTPGISSDRTTLLHFWQTGIKFSSNGTLINSTSPIAYYLRPSPPAGDIAHTYAFYLFPQGPGFSPPPAGNPFSQAQIALSTSNRYSFNVQRLSAEAGVGPPVAANYITVQNTAASTTAASASRVATGSAVGTGGAAATTGPSSFKGAGNSQLTNMKQILGVCMLTAMFAVAAGAFLVNTV